MATMKVFDIEEQEFMKLADKFYLALNLTKICSISCNILNNEFTSGRLSQQEKDCLNVCAKNIERTQSNFLSRAKQSLNLPPVEDDDDRDE